MIINLALLATIISCTYAVGIYEQCAGEGYGTFPCNAGLQCFRRNKWYSSCQPSCPRNVGWECETYLPLVPPVTVAGGFEQCGGDGWVGPKVCATGYVCYARSVYYSQCRAPVDCPPGWACAALIATTARTTTTTTTTTTPAYTGPVILPAYGKCNNVGTAICPTGTGCFRNNALYSECRPSCPPTWACETDVVVADEQCGGEGYIGVTRCAEGLRCFARSKWYSKCAASCPGAEWGC